MGMILYSFLLALALLVSAPWWVWRLLTNGRYRAGLAGRLGGVPLPVREAVAGRDTIWLHAVSVGEVLAAERLIERVRAELPGWTIAVSTTTAAGNKLATERLVGVPVFYMPLDFKFAMRSYLEALRPRLVVLMESELWPRMLTECARDGVPVAVVNARVSDRSYPRYRRLRWLWKPLLGKVALFLAQGDESAGRLERIGVSLNRIRVVGNLKYDAPAPVPGEIVAALAANLPPEADFVVCGSTLEGEEIEILAAWTRWMTTGHRSVLLIAPRHPERFGAVVRLIGENAVRVSEFVKQPRPLQSGEVLVLDSIGSLGSVYRLATVAFIGGSMVPKGGHNPLEPARFGVPVLIGPSYENFREIVEAMRARDAISIVEGGNLTLALHQAMSGGRAMGQRGREFFEAQTGATERTLLALKNLLSRTRRP